MQSVATRLKHLRERTGLSIGAVARELGRKKTTYAWYEAGYKRPYLPADLVKALIPIFEQRGVGRAELLPLAGLTEALSGRPVKPSGSPRTGPRETLDFAGEAYSAIPVYDIRAAAGAGALNGDETPETFGLHRTQWLSRLTRATLDMLALITVAGDSMWETLHDGDQVLVDRSVRNVGRDGIYVIRLGEEMQVKRVSRHPATKRLTVKSDNPNYPTYSDVDPEALDVIGRVVWLGRNLG